MHGFRLLAILSIAAVLPLMAERTAHAYGDLTVHYARVDTSNCARLSGDLPVIAFSNGCQLDDSVDGTFFEKDVGGIAVKLELHDDNGLAAKVEFHSLGENSGFMTREMTATQSMSRYAGGRRSGLDVLLYRPSPQRAWHEQRHRQDCR